MIRLAGITEEAHFAEVVVHNITATRLLLEAARRHHVPRVVLANIHHVTGMNPIGATAESLAPAPDSFYAVSKITLEALGYLYAHKTDMQVVAVRIGSPCTHPTEPRYRATWISPRDTTALLHAAATSPLPDRFLTVYGTSDNSETWWPRTGWDTLGYRPADNAAHHPGTVPLTNRWTGGAFADQDLPALESRMQLAVLGSPIGQALSPVLHRAAYQALGLDWTYHAIDCTPDGLAYFLSSLDDTWAGLSLTMPLKQTSVPLLDRASDTVVRTGAANTILVADGQLIGENTDLYGMTQALSEAGVTTASGVTVLGAGATACTALAAAHELGCDRVTVIARNAGRARQFLEPAAERIGVEVRITPWTEAPAHLGAELVISALPPGAADELASLWKPAAGTLMDVLYRSWPTPLALAAATAGRRVIGGLPMLVHQAARQVALQTKCPRPPYEDMLTAASAAVHQLGCGETG